MTFFKSTTTLCFTVALFCTTSLLGQEQKQSHGEVGFNFGSLNLTNINFSGFWKKKTGEDRYRRLRVLSGNLSAGLVDEEFDADFFLGVAVGREKRRNLDDRLQFYRGIEFIGNVSFRDRGEIDTQLGIQPGLGFVIGLQHSLNDRWAVNVETIPSIGLNFGINLEEDGGKLLVQGGITNFFSLGLVRKF